MANLCYAEFSIIGEKNNVDEFVRALEEQNNIYDLDVTHSIYLEDKNHCLTSYVVGGFDCDWNIFYSVFNKKKMKRIIHKYNLTIEMYSREGDEEEHYFIENGKTVVNDFVDTFRGVGLDWDFKLTDDYVERVHKYDRLVIVDGNV